MPRKIEKAPEIEYTNVPYSFLGFSGIKPPGTNIDYTPEMIKEFVKCSQDPLYFITNYYYIVELDKGLTKINLWDFQYDFIDHLHNNRFSIILASRQVGKSIISVGYILWYILFHPYKYVAVLSKKAKDASDIMKKLKRSYESIPQWLQQNVAGWAQTSITLENGSEVTSQATTETAGRSASANILFLDEFAFVPQNIATDFYKSAYPIISNSKESKVIICSTPNGHNHFFMMLDKARKGENAYKDFVIHWTQVPGRDEEWKKETIANLAINPHIDDANSTFAQEYDLSFENSDKKILIGPGIQRRIANHISNNVKEIQSSIAELKEMDHLTIFEDPDPGFGYYISADVAEGIGKNYSVAHVLKLLPEGYKQVAIYRNNSIIPVAFSYVIETISKAYNNASILIENRNPGNSTLDHLFYMIESQNVIHSSFKKKDELGIKTTKKNRDKGITKLKEYLEYEILEINDFITFGEITNFVRNKFGKFKAESGCDDTVMALVLFCYWTTREEFEGFGSDEILRKTRQKIEKDNPYLLDLNKINKLESEKGGITVVNNLDYVTYLNLKRKK